MWGDGGGGRQGLIQKEKVHIDCEKGAQINILASKIATKWWSNITIKEPKQTMLHLFFIFSLLCSYDVGYLMRKLELCLMEVSVLLKI